MEENDPEVSDNQSAETNEPSSGWKSHLNPDLRDSPLISKFDDSPDGLSKAFQSHAELEHLLGYEKVPIPRDPNDIAGWARFSKAMGIPDDGSGYELPDAELPTELQGLTIDKKLFADEMLRHKVHPQAVKGLWEFYQQKTIEDYRSFLEKQEAQKVDTINSLKKEWGNSFEHRIKISESVLNKFADSKESADYLAKVLAGDLRGVKFLAKIGEQFAENSLGDDVSFSPTESFEEIDAMRKDINGPYMNAKGKFSDAEHNAAVAKVNAMLASINRGRR